MKHPLWMPETVQSALRRRRARHHQYLLDPHREAFVTEARAFGIATNRRDDDYAVALTEFEKASVSRPESTQPVLAARPELTRLAFAIARFTRPERAVETGVAEGISTAAVLHAMNLNGYGHLYSIDLPVLSADENEFVGRLVSQDLRDRWTLELGPSGKVLAPLVKRVAPIDLFLHDSDHSYSSQIREYETVWPYLRSGGTLISDDVANPAFFEFASTVGARPLLIGDPAAESAVGLLRKEGA